MDLKINFPNFPNPLYLKGGHITSFNGKKLLTLFTQHYIITDSDITPGIPQVYTYDLERKNLVDRVNNLKEYLLNCD
jgi:hypothetical protein